MNTVSHIDHFYTDPRRIGKICIVQGARVSCAPGGRIEPHVHLDWYELTVITGGRGSIVTNDTATGVEEGDIYLSLPADCHAIFSDGASPLEYDCISFFCADDALLRRIENAARGHQSPEVRRIGDRRIGTLTGEMISALGRDEEDAEEILEHLAGLTVLLLVRELERGTERSPEHPIRQQEQFCSQVMEYVDTHIFSIQNLAELGEAMNYSYSYLSRQFHATTGCTLQEYYQTSRLKTANLLLREGKLKVREIAELLHYGSIYAFSKAYKRHFGHSPTQTGRSFPAGAEHGENGAKNG